MIAPAPPLKYRKRPPKIRAAVVSPVVPLTLVAGTYETGLTVTLAFDRAIDVAGIDPLLISVFDGPGERQYVGISVVDQPTASSVVIELTIVQEWGGPDVTLSASAGNGIVAVDDGSAWAGVVDLALPFG